MKTAILLFSSLLFACGSSADSTPASTKGAPTAPEASAPRGPRFATPEGWIEEAPENRMRAKQYSLPGAEGSEPALAVVAYWPGGIGGVEVNLDRWVSQVGSDRSAAELSGEERWVTETNGYLATHVHVEGQIKPMEGMGKDIVSTEAGAILAAYIEPDGTNDVWTVKVTGPSATVQAHKERYAAFVAGL